MEKREGLDALTLLGSQKTKYSFDYDPSVLEAVPNTHSDRDYFVKFNCPEFTSLCPKPASRILRPFIFPIFRIS